MTLPWIAIHAACFTVTPFCNLPWLAKKVVIVCLQDTSVDKRATIKINATCDEVTLL
jgi:hypothetical protein